MITVENLKIQKVVTSYLVVYNRFTVLQAELLQLSTPTVVPSIIILVAPFWLMTGNLYYVNSVQSFIEISMYAIYL